MRQLEGNGPFSFPFEPSKDASTRTLEARELGLCGLLLRRLLRLLLIVLLCLPGAGPGRTTRHQNGYVGWTSVPKMVRWLRGYM